jgi:DNA-binding NarL/FixJ family response regulator
MVNIIVAEPNQVLRLGIRSILTSRPGFSIRAEVLDAEQLRSAFLATPHDVVLAEMGLLKQIGASSLRDLRQARPDSRFLVHSYEIDTDFGAEAFRFGATGYMANDCTSADLCAAVINVAAGRPYVTRSLGEQLAMAVCFRASNLPHATLNRRELLVFKMLSIGLKVSDVARQLGKSVDTILTVKAQIMAKMQLPDESELVRHAISQSVLQSGRR